MNQSTQQQLLKGQVFRILLGIVWYWLASYGPITQAQTFDFTPGLQNAYTEVTKFKIPHARQLLAKEPSNNGIKIWLDDLADMITVYANESEGDYDNLYDNADERLDMLEDIDPKSPYNRLLRAEIKFHWALVQMKLGHETKAGMNVIGAYKLLEENKKLFPSFTPTNKILGVIHVLIGSVPENYRWITKILGLKGNIDQGVHELELASQDKIFGTEARFYKLFVQSYILPINDRVRNEVADYIQKNPESLSAVFLGVAIAEKDNKSEQAWRILQKIPTTQGYLVLPIFDLYTGDIYLQKGQYDKAEVYYSNYLKKFRGHSFIKDAHYKLFLCNWLGVEDNKAKGYLLQINNVGKKLSESDKAAQKFYETYAKTKSLPNKALIKARFATDGGYYKEALEYINDLSESVCTSTIEKAEYNFRKGKILQNLNDTDQAITLFERSVTLASNLDTHFGASSSLQLGYIFQKRKDNKKAIGWFEKAISYKKHEYKNSIDNKAQAALTELKE